MSPDRSPSSDRSGELPGSNLVRKLFEKFQRGLEAKASESMPRDLDALFSTVPENERDSEQEKDTATQLKDTATQLRDTATQLRDLFSRDLHPEDQYPEDLVAQDPQVSSPAHLDAATASQLDRRVAEGIRELQPRLAPEPISLSGFPLAPEPDRAAPAGAPKWTGLAAASLLGMLYLWGQGYLSQSPNGQGPLFVLVDVEKPLDTSMDPGAISLAAAGVIDFVEGSARQEDPSVGTPKKGGEE